MVESGFLNRELAAEMAKLGHGDRMMIADAGLPVPAQTKVIDLALKANDPTALEILEEILQHFLAEKAILSDATESVSPSRAVAFRACLGSEVEIEVVPHQTLVNELTRQVKFVVRSGDFTAASNLVLQSAAGPRFYFEK